MRKTRILLLSIFLMLSGCQRVENEEQREIENERTLEAAHALYEEDSCDSYRRGLLDKELQDQYDLLYAAIANHEKAVILDGSMEHIDAVYNAVNYDHPEFFWLDYNYYQELKLASEEQRKTAVKPNYELEDIEEIKQAKKQVDQEVEAVLEHALSLSTEYEKVKYFYDYVIDRTEYVDGQANNQNMLSVFLDQQGVCVGYAKSMKYLLDRSGFENGIVFVHDREDPLTGHVINRVKMDGELYYLDATYGDLDVEKTYADYRYGYFAMTSEEMTRVYRPDEDYEETDAIQDSYFVKNHAYLSTYDESAIIAMIARNLKDPNPCLSIKCSDEATYRQVASLLDGQHIYDLFSSAGFWANGISFYADEDLLCFFVNYY